MVDARHFSVEPIGIGAVLRNYRLTVQPHQREYAWEDVEIRKLLADLSKALNDNKDYFLGTITTIIKDADQLQVIDGQQRLATTAILLASIKDYIKDNLPGDAIIADDIENNFLTGIDREQKERTPKLILNITDRDYYKKRIQERAISERKTSPSHYRIDNAARLAQGHVVGIAKIHDKRDQGDILNKWITFIERDAAVILLKSPAAASAFKMFETLNARGKDTTQADLVKNYLFGETPTRLEEAIQIWGGMKRVMDSLSETDDDMTLEFLRQLVISYYGHTSEEDIYDVVQKNARGTAAAISLLSKLNSGATDYAAILNSDHPKWADYPDTTRKSVATLLSLGMKPFRPLLLAIVREFSPEEADKSLRFMLDLAVRFLTVGGGRSSSVFESIGAASRAISEKRATTLRELSAELSKIIINDIEFVNGFKTATVSKAGLARYYLRAMEQTRRSEPCSYFIVNDNKETITLEHILPEEPEGNWPQFTKEEVDAYSRRIGNLALLDKPNNSASRSAPFSAKKAIYGSVPYDFTSQLAVVTDWTKDSIVKRQAQMADVALKTWPMKTH